MGLRTPARATGNDDGVLRSGQLGHHGGHIGIGGVRGRGLVAAGIGHHDGIAQHVLGQRDHHRARAAAGGHCKRAGNGLGDARRIIDLGGPLDHAAKHGAVVQLLEGLAPARRALDLANEEDHWGRVLHRDMQPGRGVRRARPPRDHADSGLAGELALRFGHHRGAALLAADRRFDGRVIKRIEHRQKALARHRENLLHAVDQQLVHHQLATSACLLLVCHVLSPWSCHRGARSGGLDRIWPGYTLRQRSKRLRSAAKNGSI